MWVVLPACLQDLLTMHRPTPLWADNACSNLSSTFVPWGNLKNMLFIQIQHISMHILQESTLPEAYLLMHLP